MIHFRISVFSLFRIYFLLMHLVCDFDDTLTNTTKYWNFWLDKLEKVGVSRERAIETGSRLFIERFTLKRHMDALSIQDQTAVQLLNEMEEHVKEFGKTYIFPDVHPFLLEHNTNHSFSLLTYGDETNQRWRVSESGIGPYFQPVRIAGPEKHKVEFLKEILQTTAEQIIFVDDSPNELNPVVDAGLPIKLYRIVRPGAKHDYVHERDDVAWTRIGSIDEIKI